MSTVTKPKIGQRLTTLSGIYVGIAGDKEAGAPRHLVLLNATPPTELMSHKAAAAWAAQLGDGTRLPTVAEAMLIFANLRASCRRGTTGLARRPPATSPSW